ncbi:MAG: hypothetical protein CK550_05260 [Gemmatimonadetes bacterium]|nr:MAG: hypothetical protein CK550_05260 [Gemmatimonadota bacterium]
MTAVPHALAIGQSVPAAPAAASVVAPKPIVWSRDPKVDSAFIANYSAPGIPAGYRLRIDPQTRYTTSLRYTRNAGAVLVKGGPGHIMYSPTDTASGSYSVTTTVSQRARSKPKDAYGLFVGGRSLTTSKQTYGYFLIREGGEYLVKVRDADSMRVIIDWTRHRAIPMDTARGAITASLAILVAPDSTRFVVNGQQVASLPAGVIPSSGIAGVRVNKDLQVRVAPVRIAR